MDKILQSGQILTDKLYHDILNSLSTFGRDPVVVVSQPGGVEKPLNVLPVLSPGSSHSQSPLRPDDRQSEFRAEAWPERIFFFFLCWTIEQLVIISLVVVDGGWGEWSRFSPFSETCGGGVITRIMNCNDPSPLNGGKDCPGEYFESRECNKDPCKSQKPLV